MKKKKGIAVLMALALAVQLVPLPAGGFGIASVSEAADPVNEKGTDGNITWEFDAAAMTLTLTGTGTGEMNVYRSKKYEDSKYNTVYRTDAPWGKYGEWITEIVIGNGVTTISDYAFYGCKAVTSVTMTDTVKSIGNYAFYSCESLPSITLSKKLTNIGQGAFLDCTALESFAWPSKITAVEDDTFNGCQALKSVTGLGQVTSYGDSAFYGCKKLESISLNANALDMGSYVFAETGLTSVTWPANNHEISPYAFFNCGGLSKIVIPKGVDKIGDFAFRGCGSASTLSIGNDVETIGRSAFASCNSLTKATWSTNAKATSISDSAFADCEALESFTVPSNVTRIGSHAFYQDKKLKSLTISSGTTITSIGISAFASCEMLNDVNLNIGVTDIMDSAFKECRKLSKLTLPENALQKIGDNAFSSTALDSFQVPKSVQTIGINPFVGALKEITVHKDNKNYKVEKGMLIDKAAHMVVSYPSKAPEKNPAVPASIEKIGDQAFAAANVQGVTLPKGIAVIGAGAFQGSTVQEVNLPEGLTSIGENAFYQSGLRNAKLPKSLKNLGSKAFRYAQEMESVELPDGLETIGFEAFAHCSKLGGVKLPGSLKEMQGRAFAEDTALAVVDASGGQLMAIGEYAFYNCNKLDDIDLGGDLETLGGFAFANCTSIGEITLPDKLTLIGDSAFSGCTSLEAIIFPNSLEKVGSGALRGCTALKSADFGSVIAAISGDVFEGCPELSKITISEQNPNMVAEENVVYSRGKKKIIYYAAGMEEERFLVPEDVEVVGSKAFTYCRHLEEIRFPKSLKEMGQYAVYKNDSINKIFFYGDAPAASVIPSESRTDKGVTIYKVRNDSLYQNKVNGQIDRGMVIFVLQGSAGWDTKGWTGTDKYKDAADGKTVYQWNDTIYEFDNTRWDPAKTDRSSGVFPSGLEWKYIDEYGELQFTGEGAVPDYEEGNLFTYTDEDDKEWLDFLQKPVDHMDDIKLIQTGGATRIGKNAFRGAERLYRIMVGGNLSEIGENAFAECPCLASIDISNVTKLEKEAFRDDTAIRDDLYAWGVREIGEGVFKGCNGMTEILLGDGLKVLGAEAFAGCTSLSSMMLPESTESFGDGCFSGCSSLRAINIPASVSAIPGRCFADCGGLEKVYFYGDRPDPWADDSFDNPGENLTLYYRSVNTSWDGIGDEWNGIPVEGQDKFYTEREDHYSFANTNSSFGYDAVYHIPLQRYVTALQSVVRGSFYRAWNFNWGGSCFGMSASSAEFYEEMKVGDKFQLTDYDPGAKKLYDVGAPRKEDAALTKLIEIYQVSQFADEIGIEQAKNTGKYRELIRRVEDFERSGGLSVDSNADPLVLCVYSACSGHALVPVAVDVDDKGNYQLQVYDCNYPNSFQTLEISRDFEKISYDKYKEASFVTYSTIRDALEYADFTGKNMKRRDTESTTVAIAVNQENVSLVNGGGRDYREIPGAYEQRPMYDGEEEEFSGIRSFVLPQGEYQIEEKKTGDSSDTGKEGKEPLKYYVATEDMFSEVETSNSDAKLTVKSVAGEGKDFVILESENKDTETEITVMDVSGITREISAKASLVRIDVQNDEQMKVTVSGDASEVKVDGKEIELPETKEAEISFYASDEENPMEAGDLSCVLSLDEKDRLTGTAEAYLTWARKASGDVEVTTKVKDAEGNVIAEYVKKQEAALGIQRVFVNMSNMKTNIGDLSGEFKATCEMTLTDAQGHVLKLSQKDIVLKAAQKGDTPEEKPEATQTPAPEATQVPTAAPDSTRIPSVVNPAPVYPAPTQGTAAPKPTQTPAGTQTPTPEATQEPVFLPTQEPEASMQPTETIRPVTPDEPQVPDGAGTVAKKSLPKKGKVLTKGAFQYIVVKPAKKNGKVEVYGAKKKNAAKLAVPKKVKLKGYTFQVTGISDNAFNGMPKLKEVNIGGNVKTVGRGAFKNCKKLQFVILPGKVVTLKEKAFAGCTSLTGILVKSGKIKKVGAKAFQGVTPKVKVKTAKGKWKKYSKLFVKKGKLPQNATFIIDPVKLKYKGKAY